MNLPAKQCKAESNAVGESSTGGHMVKAFQPYDKIQEVNAEARKAGAALIQEGTATSDRKTFIYVNNRLEGNALATIDAMLSADE